MATVPYNVLKTAMVNGDINLGTDSIKVLLVTDTYVPNVDTHTNLTHVTDEVVGTGYTAGGKPLVNQAVLTDLTNDRAALDADDLTWTAATITARAAVLYKDTGTPSTSKLIGYLDFGTDKTSSGGDFTLVFDTTGILRLS